MLGLLRRLTGGFVGKIVSQASRGQTELPVEKPKDAFDEFDAEWRPHLRSSDTYEHFEKNWSVVRAQVDKNPTAKSRFPALLRALWSTFWIEVLKAAVLKLLWGGFLILSIAFFVFRILSYVRFKATDKEHTQEERADSYWLCCFFFVSMVLLSISLQQMTFVSTNLGIRVKSALTLTIFRKMLSREGFRSDADIVSLVAKDCSKIAEACTSLQFLWSGIFESLAIFGVLIGFTGVSALPGLGLLIISLPLQYFLGVKMALMKTTASKDSKKRIKLIEETLRGVKLIKIYGWEKFFFQHIEEVREKETSTVGSVNMIKSFILALIFTCPPMFCILIFGTHEMYGNLEATMAFTTLTFFNTLRLPFVKLPKSLRDVLDAFSAIERIQSFLLEVDLKDTEDHASSATPPTSGIALTAASFSYGAEAPALVHDVTLSAPAGSLVMVAGPVASGKSNLIKAILGQMTCAGGARAVGGTLAYVPQVPWTAIGTVRDNIVFGKPFDEALYRRVLQACALERDMTLMPDGDLTRIGERGGNLSGGQKQRIALARAAYSRADVCVLDSPLSAVDMHTCRHIFRHCLQGMMLARGATVVLATHQAELLPLADTVVIMRDGRVAYGGAYDYASIRPYIPTALDVPSSAGAAATAPAVDAGSDHASDQAKPPAAAGDDGKKAAGGDDGHKAAAGAAAKGAAAPDARSKAAPSRSAGSTYWTYIHFIGPALLALSVVVFIGAQLVRIFSDIWISRWATRQYPDQSETWYILIYLAYVCCFFVGVVVRSFFFLSLGLRASNRIHESVLSAVLRAPMAYFNVTPVGTLLSFFSKDMDQLDDVLVDNLCMCITYVCILCTTLGVVIGTLPVFGAIVGGLIVVFLYTFRRYARACTLLKARASVATEDVVGHTSETLSGIAVVRAFGAQPRFLAACEQLQDRCATSGHALSSLTVWLSFRLDLVGCLLVFATCLLAVTNEGAITAAASGLAVSNSFQILLFFSIMSATMGEIHTNVGSVDRAADLQKVEAERDDPAGAAPGAGAGGAQAGAAPEGWPSRGEVKFNQVVMSYTPDKPPVLCGVDLALRAGEKVGVVGRTGAGKSSLIVALYRLAESSGGTIAVDGVVTAGLRLADLRQRIAIIPQEPVMFSGTLRSNLDPFGIHPDDKLLAALDACLLGPTAKAAGGLDGAVDFMGGNFSLGQQQLVCLARAMLNPSRLLLMDEATAALDSDTDAAVQLVLRRHFGERTVLTIAHRLDTIIDSDRILVMDAGRVAEFAPPQALLADPSSIFHSLCREAGPAQFRALQDAAANAAASRSAAAPAPAPAVLAADPASLGLAVGEVLIGRA